jgi:general secretion pathway protein A
VQGLACLESTDSLDTLRRLNRPAVLRLIDEKRATRYAALIALNEDRASLVVGDKVRVVNIGELGRRWSGEYLLLWRKPPGYNGQPSSKENASFLAWVDKQLSAARAGTGHEGRPRDDLAKRVKEFQVLAGLVPDGKVGPRTLICLTDATNADDPSLRKPKGGR